MFHAEVGGLFRGFEFSGEVDHEEKSTGQRSWSLIFKAVVCHGKSRQSNLLLRVKVNTGRQSDLLLQGKVNTGQHFYELVGGMV